MMGQNSLTFGVVEENAKLATGCCLQSLMAAAWLATESLSGLSVSSYGSFFLKKLRNI
jgi:hypothetical protein